MGAWQMVKVGDFLFAREGKYKPTTPEISSLKRINKIDFSGRFYLATKPSKTNMIRIEPGDLVISGINVAKGALGIFEGNEPVTATIHYSSYSFDNEKINVEYFKRFLKSPLFIKLLKEQVKGGIKTEIKPKHLLPLVIPLPNINEQKLIVSHFLKIENEDVELRDELTHQQTLLKKLRQQILQEAIEGRLTTEWRADNPDIEPASELLARIQAEKAQLIKDKKIKKQKPLPPISENEKPFELPDGWAWCRLNELFNFIDYRGKTPNKISAGIRLITARNVKMGKLSLEPQDFISNSEYEERMTRGFPENGDILFTTEAPLGNVCLLELDDQQISTGQRLITFQSYSDLVINKTFLFFMLSPFYQELLIEKATGITAKGIKASRLKEMVTPLPPLPEQKAIVTKVEKLLTLCDQLESQITNNQSHAEQLMQSVLKEAFTQPEAA